MLLVALSLLICYSLVVNEILKAGFLWESWDIPMILPGACLIRFNLPPKKAAWGPPYPKGTPNL